MNSQLTDLPDEVQELLLQHESEKIMRLESFSQAVAKKRDEAVAARAASGIEDVWLEDEEHYVGIDNANRGSTKLIKPASMNGGVATQRKDTTTRSTVFLNITRPYVDAIVARTCDILLPTDDRNWSIQPTPIPSLVKAQEDNTPLQQPMQPMPQPMPMQPPGGPQMAPQGMRQPGMPQQGPQPGMMQAPPPQQPPTVADLAKELMAKARDAAEGAEKQIDDWLQEAGYNAENRKVIHDAARLGTGILKGPFPEKRTSLVFIDGSLEAEVSLNPASKRVDPWNFYPDPACGENIHDGQFCFEKDYLTAKKLRELKDIPGYLAGQIDAVIEEGPQTRDSVENKATPFGRKSSDKDLYEVWYGYISVEKDDLEAAGVDLTDLKADHISAIVTIVNRRVIKAAVNPLDSGGFPYDVIPWQRVSGVWVGIGVSRQIRAPQQELNAANRNMMDNAGLSGGPLLVIRQNMITPADGDWTLRPRKIFYATADADMRTVNDAITAINIPSMQNELMNIIQFSLKVAEQITGFPLLMMGQGGQSTPDTYGGQILATANASTVLRATARSYDDFITVPQIGRYYEYLMLYGEDDSIKGDFQVIARGSSTLVEKEVQAQEIVQLIQMSANPAFGLDPAKLMAEYLKSRRFDARKFQLSDEQKAQQAQQPQPSAPAVEAAKIRSQASVDVAKINMEREIGKIKAEYELEIQAAQQGHISPQMAAAQAQIAAAKIRAESEQAKEQSRANTELAYAEAQARMAMVNDQANMRELELKREIALLSYSEKHKLTLEQTKASLATTAMQEQTKRELAAAKLQMEKRDYQDDRSHDFNKHVQNIVSNQDTATTAREHEAEKQRLQHEHELELQKIQLEKARKSVSDAPGKRQ